MVEHTALQDRQWITLWRWAGGGSIGMYVQVRAHVFTYVSAHCPPIARVYVNSRTHTIVPHTFASSSSSSLSQPKPSSPSPGDPVVYHSSSTYQTLIQSEYKCCPLKQAGNGGKPSTTSTTELFLRSRLFSSLLVVRVLNEYVWLLLAAAAAEELLMECARRCVRFA